MELKANPCPMCGNENPTLVRTAGSEEGSVQIRCERCGFVSEFARTRMDALALWNVATSKRAGKPAELSETQQPTTRKTILDAAEKCVCHDRQDTHGRPEDSFGAIADLWTAYLDIGRDITPVDVAQMMILLKVGRAKENPKHQDNWVDMAGYAACAGEIAADVYGNDS